MKQLSKIQLTCLSSLIAVIFWIYAICYRNGNLLRILTDFQVSWIPITLTLVFLVIWFLSFNFLYGFANSTVWIGKLFVYVIGIYFSFIIVDLLVTPFFYYLNSVNLYKKSEMLTGFNNSIFHYLFLCMGLVFIGHDLILISTNIKGNAKLTLRIAWLCFMILFIAYFIFN